MLSVLTLNIEHDAHHWKARARLVRRWIERLAPDLIGLQEVLRGPRMDQAAELLEEAGYHVDYVAAGRWRDGLAFGNAVGARWPLSGREELRLPDLGDGETRAALSVEVASPFGALSFTTTHLHWKLHHGAVRERQVVALCDLVLRRRLDGDFPPILVGDFNAEPESAEIRYVCGLQSLGGRSVHFRDAWRVAGGDGPGLTWSFRNPYTRRWYEPERRIDYVFVGPPRGDGVGAVERCWVVCDQEEDGLWPSDHFGVLAELRTEPGQATR